MFDDGFARLGRLLILAAVPLVMAVPSAPAFAACANPAGNEGEFIYNDDHNVMQFCNGTDWVGMAGGSVGSGGASALTGLSDVTISSPSDGQVLKYNSGVWENAADGGSGVAGSDMQVQFNDGGSTLAGAAQLFWDKANNRLGVNTSTPAQALDISGAVSTNKLAFKMVTGAPAPNAGSGLWSSDGTNVWRTGGNVGIGTVPGRLLHVGTASSETVVRISTDASHTAQLEFMRGSTGSYVGVAEGGPANTYMDFWTYENIPLRFGANNAEVMRILTNGNVGIGTVSPAYKLSVAGNVHIDEGGPWGGGILIRRGPGDNATLTTYNQRIDTWFGLAFGSTCGTGSSCPDNTNAKLVMNMRTGDFTIAGDGYKPGGGSWTASSDARLKDVDGTYDSGLDSIVRLSPVRFHYKKDNPRNEPSDREFVGLIAQETMEVMPELVSLRDDGYYDLDPSALSFALINAVQELKAANDNLRAEFEAYKATHP